MDATEFLKARERMCHFSAEDCSDCPVYQAKGKFVACRAWIQNHPEEAVAIVERWVRERPKNVRQNEFLMRYPNAAVDEYGIPLVCPKDIFADADIDCNAQECSDCKKAFWMQEVEP